LKKFDVQLLAGTGRNRVFCFLLPTGGRVEASHKRLRLFWCLPAVADELRAQRRMWLFKVLSDTAHYSQYIATVLGKLKWEQKHTVDQSSGEQTDTANTYAKQKEKDILHLKQYDEAEHFTHFVTNKNGRINFHKRFEADQQGKNVAAQLRAATAREEAALEELEAEASRAAEWAAAEHDAGKEEAKAVFGEEFVL